MNESNKDRPIPAQQSYDQALQLLAESRENYEKQFGFSSDADWVYKDLAELFIVDLPAQQSPAVAVPELKDIEVTDQMASAFNQAICDDAMNDQDIEAVKTGLRAAISHLHPMPKSFYELEIERLVALNDSLLANEIRLIERLRTMQPSPRITEQDAREIAISYALHRGTEYNRGYAEMFVGQFFATEEGRAILAKLNNKNNIPN